MFAVLVDTSTNAPFGPLLFLSNVYPISWTSRCTITAKGHITITPEANHLMTFEQPGSVGQETASSPFLREDILSGSLTARLLKVVRAWPTERRPYSPALSYMYMWFPFLKHNVCTGTCTEQVLHRRTSMTRVQNFLGTRKSGFIVAW